MSSYLAIEPEFAWKVEPLEDGSRLLTIATEYEEIRIAWDGKSANKLSDKMRTIETTGKMPDGSPDGNNGH